MKRKMVIVLACCMALSLASCGLDSEEASSFQAETVEQQDTQSPQIADSEEGKETAQAPITEEQALDAVRKYCIASQPDLEDMVNSDEYSIYWEVSTNDAGEIVVLYRSYTAALIRYYIDPATGDAYVTEQVPGVTDDEQNSGETLNIREYMD
ncbi:MAG: hypothetical protein E7307_12800 [Butyrivibrio sp.]|nr:hypothetical protein [Butyrivibrio sp.]